MKTSCLTCFASSNLPVNEVTQEQNSNCASNNLHLRVGPASDVGARDQFHRPARRISIRRQDLATSARELFGAIHLH